MSHRTAPCAFAVTALALALSAPAQASFFSDGKVLIDLRLRFENVDDAAFARDADALTLRSRLGWRSGNVQGFYLLAEVEDVQALDDSYNSTANGRSQYPVVVDPEGSEWNQALIGWDSGSGSVVQAGRQRLSYDNQRFIGNVGWRQNEQTFDALSIRHAVNDKVTLNYAWLDKAHRIFGNAHPNPLQAEFDLDAHLLNLGWNTGIGSFVGYAYLVENQDTAAASTRSLGFRYAGKQNLSGGQEWFYSAELASQEGWRDAPSTGSAGYRMLETGLRHQGHALRIGLETLDSNGRRAFQTPLATGHAFNGWADRFLATPINGLDDRYLKLDGPLGPLRYLIAWHDFSAERGSADYGRELDAQLIWPFAKGWTALAKYADYRSDGFGSDVSKLWLSLDYRY
jgi:hypothetical protein